MYKALLPLLLTTLLLTGCRSQPVAPTPETPPATTIPEEIILTDDYSTETFPGWDDRNAFEIGLVPSQHHYLEELVDAPIYHISYEIDADLVTIRGHEEIRYTNQENIALEEIAFHLFPNTLGGNMEIENISIDGETDIPVNYGDQKSYMMLPLPVSIKPGESVIITMDFTTTAPNDLERNYGILASTESVLALAHAYPMLSVYDDEGWNIDIPSEQGDITYGDASFYIVRVNAPRELVLVGSGSHLASKFENDRQTIVFAIGPARDFYLAASQDYVCISNFLVNYTINSCAPTELHDSAQIALDVAAEAINMYGALYAPYPYTEFSIVTTPTYALGIEYPGMTAINIDLYDPTTNFGGMPASVYLESTIAHEVGHQWFYNLVGNDQLDNPWLDESLVQYITWQYYATRYGESGKAGFGEALDSRWGRVDHAKIPIGETVASYGSEEYSGIIYGRGAFFFEALSEKMGAEAFQNFITEYTQRQEWKIATPESLRALAEKHCNCDLENLFMEWVY